MPCCQAGVVSVPNVLFETEIAGKTIGWSKDKELFSYSTMDAVSDWSDRNNVGTRAGGALQGAAGTLQTAGGIGSCFILCETGIGAAASIYLTGSGIDNANTGFTIMFSGKPANTVGAQTIALATGLSLEKAELLYGVTQIMVGGSALNAANQSGAGLNKAVQAQNTGAFDNAASKGCTGALCQNGACFTAGTLIQTSEGLKAIETFVGGEYVWSRSDTTHEYSFKRVLATKATADQEIYDLIVRNAKGQEELFQTTSEHPFWIKDHGWRKASLLAENDVLLDRDNSELHVVSLIKTTERQTVFNISVEHFATYHIGKMGVWVHNADCFDLGTTTRQQEISNIFNYQNRNSNIGIQMGDKSLVQIPNNGSAKMFSGASTEDVMKYFQDLTGIKQLPTPRVIPGKGTIYTVNTPQGNFTLRDFATSSNNTGSAWTLDIPGSITGTKHGTEIKFLK